VDLSYWRDTSGCCWARRQTTRHALTAHGSKYNTFCLPPKYVELSMNIFYCPCPCPACSIQTDSQWSKSSCTVRLLNRDDSSDLVRKYPHSWCSLHWLRMATFSTRSLLGRSSLVTGDRKGCPLALHTRKTSKMAARS